MTDMKDSIGGKQKTSIIRSVGVLVSGTVFAHAITAMALPVLSRLYSPSDFSALAVFSGLMSVIAVAACLRFDVAVPIIDSDLDAINLLALALTCAALVSAIIAIPSIFLSKYIAALLNQPILQNFLWLLPIGVFLAAGFSVLQNWFVRKKQFSLITYSKIGQSSVGAVTQIGMGIGKVSPLGLLVGYVMNAGAACVVMGYRFVKEESGLIRRITWQQMKVLFVVHHRFPKYSTLESLCNVAAIQIPIILIAVVAVGPEAGFLTMAINVMQAPMALVGTAIGQVYISHAPEKYSEGNLGGFTTEILGGLLKAGVGPLLFVGIVSPVAFSIVFGEEWRRAGQMVAWMTPWFIMQFIASPISMALYIIGYQRAALCLHIFGLVVRVTSVLVVGALAANWVTEAFAVSGFIIYLLLLIVVLRAAAVSSSQVMHRIVKCVPHVMMWVVIGIGVVIVCNSIHGRI
jgi:O-antigen/teichoic acid export membrane protein